MLRSILLFSASVLLSFQASALTVKGVDLPEKVTMENQALVLNGAGIRTKMFVDGYVAALYLTAKNKDAKSIIEADAPMAVRLTITSGLITPDRMSESTRDGFVRSTGGNIAPIEKEIDVMISAFKAEVKEGDVYDLVYIPAQGVHVYRNGEKKAEVKGMAFKKAMFGIWLSDNNIQSSLRKAMLGS